MTSMAGRKQEILVLRGDSDYPACFAITKKESILGRGIECDHIIPSTCVSRKHARLEVLEGGIRVTDLDSTNGTYVNEQPITSVFVPVGQSIRFGSRTLVVQRENQPAEERTGRADFPPNLEEGLSPAQRNVLQLAIKGLSEKVIAKKVNLSAHTIHCHISAIYRHFNVNSRNQLIIHFNKIKKATEKPSGNK